LLKPALARGRLRCIAATTYQEYIKYFEKDPALTRRFQNIIIGEPDDKKTEEMLRSSVSALEKHHGVTVTEEAVIQAVKLSRRYIPARQLPDKAVSVLDTACAKAALSQNAEPAELEYVSRHIDALRLEADLLRREEATGLNHKDELAGIEHDIAAEEEHKKELEERYEKEKTEVTELLALIEKETNPETIAAKRKALHELQGSNPMVLPQVDGQAVAQVVAEWTGIPLQRMAVDEIKGVLNLADELKKRVIGQGHSLELIAKRVATARANLSDPDKPQAVLMFAGPSGVGKTETALALAEQVFGSENQIITINMSEFQEAHTVSTLKGAPPGYVGYGEGGVLTEAVRRKPYSVVLLDEVEKAHPDVHEVFFQVFDKGQMEDGSGRLINFRNTIILLTTNVGTETIEALCADTNKAPTPEELEAAIRDDMGKVFPAALLGRMQIIPYYPLGKEALYRIIDLKLGKIVRRVKEQYNASLTYTDAVKDEIISRCDNAASGARLVDSIVNNTVLPEISSRFLEAVMEGREIKEITIDATQGDAKDGGFTYGNI
jgi:type VI secretion system protein VasG